MPDELDIALPRDSLGPTSLTTGTRLRQVTALILFLHDWR